MRKTLISFSNLFYAQKHRNKDKKILKIIFSMVFFNI